METEHCVSQSLGTVLPPNGQEISFLHTAAPSYSVCFSQAISPVEYVPTAEPFCVQTSSQAPAPTQASSLSSLFLQAYIFLHFRLD